MKNKILLTVLTASLLLSACASSQVSEPEASTSEELSIASSSVAICEILDELEYDKVIGIPTTSAGIPERYADAKEIGSPMNPDLEIVKQLSPDLLLSPKTLESSLSESYLAAGISSAFLDLSSVEGMYSAIASLGELLDREEQANALVADYETYMQNYHSDVEEQPKVLLLMTFPDGFYLVATEDSYVGNLVKLAGGENVYGSEYNSDTSGFVSINPEDIVQKDPDYILVFAHYSEEEAFAYMEGEFEENQTWQYFDAVKEGNIIYLPSEYFGMSATLDWKDSLEYLQPYFYGEEA